MDISVRKQKEQRDDETRSKARKGTGKGRGIFSLLLPEENREPLKDCVVGAESWALEATQKLSSANGKNEYAHGWDGLAPIAAPPLPIPTFPLKAKEAQMPHNPAAYVFKPETGK